MFLVTVLGASVTAVGLLEGTAEAIASITKVFSGTLSDWLGKRKLLTVLGYGLAAVTKPLFALAPTAGWVFAARGIDRIGKGIRGAPRDALIAELTPAPIRGAAFGLRQTLDTVGAFAGPLLAIALMAATDDSFRTVFWLAVIPALASVVVLVLFVREPRARNARDAARRAAARRRCSARLGARFWWLVLVAALFTLARFSEAFLILKVADVGLGVGYVPAVLVVMNVAYALVGVSRRLALGSLRPLGRVRRRRGVPDRRRSRARVRRFDHCGGARHRAVGTAHGLHARTARRARRRRRASRATRHGVRRLQLGHGFGAARGERARRRALGSRRTASSRFSPAPR